jgi:hypothetical protein
MLRTKLSGKRSELLEELSSSGRVTVLNNPYFRGQQFSQKRRQKLHGPWEFSQAGKCGACNCDQFKTKKLSI